MNKRTAVIYTRVSTEEQTKGYSLQTQLERCQAFAGEKGYVVSKDFRESESGEEIDRTELNNMLAYVAAHGIEVVIVYDPDRLSRGGPAHHSMIELTLAKYQARIEYVLGDYNQQSPESMLSKMIKQSIAWYENQQRRERIMRGRIGKAKAGRVIVSSRPPYGYEFVKQQMVVCEEEASVVRRIYALCIEGLSADKIALALTQDGVPTKADKLRHMHKKKNAVGVWGASSVLKILNNETYTGVWHFNKYGSKKENGKRVIRARSQEEWVPVPVPAIVDKETFAAASAARQRNKAMSKRNTKFDYLLQGLVYCKCGYQGICQARPRSYIYRCPSRKNMPARRPCDLSLYVSARRLDPLVWDAVIKILLDERNLRQAIQAQRERMQKEQQPLEERLEAILKARAETERKLAILVDQLLDDDLPRSIFGDRKQLLVGQLKTLEHEETRVRADLASVALSPAVEESLVQMAQTIREGAQDLSFAEKRSIILMLKVRVDATSKTQYKVSCLLPIAEDTIELPAKKSGSALLVNGKATTGSQEKKSVHFANTTE